MAAQDEQLPAEIRVPPATEPEPEVEVDAGTGVPPEAGVVAATHHEGAGDAGAASDAAGSSYRAVAAAEAAAEQAHRPPAELTVPPISEPVVEVDAEAHVPPEAGVVPVTHREGPDATR